MSRLSFFRLAIVLAIVGSGCSSSGGGIEVTPAKFACDGTQLIYTIRLAKDLPDTAEIRYDVSGPNGYSESLAGPLSEMLTWEQEDGSYLTKMPSDSPPECDLELGRYSMRITEEATGLLLAEGSLERVDGTSSD